VPLASALSTMLIDYVRLGLSDGNKMEATMRLMSGFMCNVALAIAVVASSVPASANTVVINFDNVDTSAGPVSGASAISYLAGYGITFSTSSPITPTIDPYPYWMNVVSGANEFGTFGIATAYSYEMSFATPLNSLSFTRPGLGSATMSAWTATAYSAANAVLGTVSEGLLGAFISAATFTLNGPDIAYVIFTDNAYNFAGTNFRLDNLTLDSTTPLPAALPLFASGLGVLGLLGWRRKRKASAALAAA
jgi:hypothetical protein